MNNPFFKPLSSILVKPSGPDCNLNCTYCFYLEKEDLFGKNQHRMDDSTLVNLIKQTMDQSGKYVNFTWQGGEPTLMGLDFFKRVVEIQQQFGHGKVVGNGLQTNGTLLDEEWADFLAEYKFLVGISLDGPEHVHDRYRLTKGGKPTWKIVERNAKMLLERGVEVNAMSTINNYSVQFPKEIYNYHKKLGLNFMQFIPILESDENGCAAQFSVEGNAYGKFLCEIFDLWYKDYTKGKNITSVRHYENIFYRYVGLEAPECTLAKCCGTYLVVEHNGDVFSCDFFVEPKWKLGNLKEARLIEMLNSPKQLEFGQNKAQLTQACRECKWLNYCNGGCVKDRVKDKRDNGHTHFCKAYKMFFKHADYKMTQLAEQWKQANRNTTFDASDYF